MHCLLARLPQVCSRDEGVDAMREGDALINDERNHCRRGQVEKSLVDRLIAKKEQLQNDIKRQEHVEGGTYATLQVRGISERHKVDRHQVLRSAELTQSLFSVLAWVLHRLFQNVLR